jgi:hypothetical protein
MPRLLGGDKLNLGARHWGGDPTPLPLLAERYIVCTAEDQRTDHERRPCNQKLLAAKRCDYC